MGGVSKHTHTHTHTHTHRVPLCFKSWTAKQILFIDGDRANCLTHSLPPSPSPSLSLSLSLSLPLSLSLSTNCEYCEQRCIGMCVILCKSQLDHKNTPWFLKERYQKLNPCTCIVYERVCMCANVCVCTYIASIRFSM